jgi:hypothetical protein
MRKATTEIFSRRELVLTDARPKVDHSRLTADDSVSGEEGIGVDRPLAIDELVLHQFSPAECDDIFG